MRFLQYPLDVLRILTSAKDFRASPVIGSERLNRMGLYGMRKALAGWVAAIYRRFLARRLPAAQRAEFDACGFVELAHFLSDDESRAVRAELCQGNWPWIEMQQPPAVTQRVNLDAATCGAHFPALARLLRNPVLNDWVRYAAGCPGQPLIALQRIASGTGTDSGASDPQSDWHMDTFHSVGKVWLFLHAVGQQDGPLAYVPGSHRSTAASRAWERQQSLTAACHPNPLHARGSFRVTPAELGTLGFGAPRVFAVQANTLVVADTGGIHRRMPSPSPTVRLEIYLTLRRNPFLSWAYPSLLGLPMVRSHWAGWAYAMYERMVRRGKPGWIPRPRQRLPADERSKLADAGPTGPSVQPASDAHASADVASR